MVHHIAIADFLSLSKQYPILDVRSPGEYGHAHIPGAYNLPLFTDEERKVVGTIYKQEGREQAIKTGLEYFGVKMRLLVEKVEMILQNHRSNEQTGEVSSPVNKTVLIHCWRGGMRSAGVAWLLDLYGFNVYTLTGGYKAFRNWVLQQFEVQYSLQIIGGYTGSGKTEVLKELQQNGYKKIDLEGIAHHKGSAFGGIGEQPQPTQELFENELGIKLHNIANGDQSQPIWIEDESRRIGLLNLPVAFWQTMQQSPLYFLSVPFENRLDYITSIYGKCKKEELISAIMRIQKRLGGLSAKNAIDFLLEDNYKEAFRILLHYYDKQYDKSNNGRALLLTMVCDSADAVTNSKLLAAQKQELYGISRGEN